MSHHHPTQTTMRRALGDVKNVQSMQQQQQQLDHKSSIHQQPTPKVTKAPPPSANNVEPIERFHWQPPPPDTFDDLLGPINERISSLSAAQWSRLLTPSRAVFASILDVHETHVDALLDKAIRDMPDNLFEDEIVFDEK